MKKTILLLLAVVISTGAFAQMQVWSNGTIIFSHSQQDVDSISFGSPMQVQTNMNATSSVTTLEGCVYVSSISGAGSSNDLYALCFIDGSNGYFSYNNTGRPSGGGSVTSPNKVFTFTYSISNSDITLIMNNRTCVGKIIGRAGLVFTTFYDLTSSSSSAQPATFLNYNR